MSSSLENLSPSRAILLQKRLAARVRITPLTRKVKFVAGCDVSTNHPQSGKDSKMGYAAVVVFDAESGEIAERATASAPLTFPYVPGLLAFREIPVLLKAFGKLKRMPDLIICDGQGVAHPRRLGIASHLGVLLNIPTIGCAKSVLCGTFREPGKRRGASSPLLDKGEGIGKMLRTREGVKSVIVSVGHMITLDEACAWILRLAEKYRLPEPVRAAHALSNFARHAEGRASLAAKR